MSHLSAIGNANNVLLLGLSSGETPASVCNELGIVEDAERSNFLGVTFAPSSAEWLSDLECPVETGLPTSAALVIVGNTSSEEPDAAATTTDARAERRWLPDPADTMALGFEIVRHLSRWAEAGGETVGCFHTLSDLLEAAGHDRTVGLLTRLLPVSAGLNARVHYHLDPTCHDEATVELLTPLFDAVVEVQGDGSLTVTRPSGARDTATDARPMTEVHPPEPGPSVDTLLSLLADSRRRRIVHYLDATDPNTAVEVDALVDRLLTADGDGGERGQRRRLAIELRHRHLPKLASADVIDYDPDAGIVRRRWGDALSLWLQWAAMAE